MPVLMQPRKGEVMRKAVDTVLVGAAFGGLLRGVLGVKRNGPYVGITTGPLSQLGLFCIRMSTSAIEPGLPDSRDDRCSEVRGRCWS